MELKVIKSVSRKPEKNWRTIYYRIYTGLLENATLNGNVEISSIPKETLVKLTYIGVKYIGSLYIPNNADITVNCAVFDLIGYITEYMKFLTPTDLLGIFPINKKYNGDKWGFKDYFYTINVLREHGLDNLIGESLEGILWDYENFDLRMFLLRMISSTTALYKEQTGINPTEEFFNEMGIPTYNREITASGQEYMVNRQTGEATPIEAKKKPVFTVLSGK